MAGCLPPGSRERKKKSAPFSVPARMKNPARAPVARPVFPLEILFYFYFLDLNLFASANVLLSSV